MSVHFKLFRNTVCIYVSQTFHAMIARIGIAIKTPSSLSTDGSVTVSILKTVYHYFDFYWINFIGIRAETASFVDTVGTRITYPVPFAFVVKGIIISKLSTPFTELVTGTVVKAVIGTPAPLTTCA